MPLDGLIIIPAQGENAVSVHSTIGKLIIIDGWLKVEHLKCLLNCAFQNSRMLPGSVCTQPMANQCIVVDQLKVEQLTFCRITTVECCLICLRCKHC